MPLVRSTVILFVLNLAAPAGCFYVALPDVIGAGGPLRDALARRGIAGREIPVVKFGSVGAPLVRFLPCSARSISARQTDFLSAADRAPGRARLALCAPHRSQSSRNLFEGLGRCRPPGPPSCMRGCGNPKDGVRKGAASFHGTSVASPLPALVFCSLMGADMECRPSMRLRLEVSSSQAFLSRQPPASYCR